VDVVGIPGDVVAFVQAKVRSMAQLESILLVRGSPDRWWTLDDVASALVTRPGPAGLHLDHLVALELAERDGRGRVRWCAHASLASVVAELARCYATRRASLVGLIYAVDPERDVNVEEDGAARWPT
jgi:hypothetical protein